MAGGDGAGYLKLSRKQFRRRDDGGCPWWCEPREYSRWEAWQDMIQSAAFAAHNRMIGGALLHLERGETPPRSVRFLATRWGRGTKWVRNFLAQAEEMGRIRAHQRTQEGHTYLIVNYETYQGEGHTEGYGEGHSEGTARAQRGHSEGTKYKKSKKSKEGEEELPLLAGWRGERMGVSEASDVQPATNGHHAEADFERWWAHHPKKVGKRKALVIWKRLRKSKELPPVDDMIAALDKQAKSGDWTRDGGQYIPHPTTYLNRGGWEDDLSGGRPRGAYGTDYDPQDDFR